jgi:hypothetical protein
MAQSRRASSRRTPAQRLTLLKLLKMVAPGQSGPAARPGEPTPPR